jgi:hypothetical protein
MRTIQGIAGTAAFLLMAGCAVQHSDDGRTAAQRYQEALGARVELSRENAFHLVLDPDAGNFGLFLGAVPLQKYTVTAVTLPRRTVAFFEVQSCTDPTGSAWRGGILDPPRNRDRFEMEYRGEADDADEPVDADDQPQPPKIPPPPEEVVVAPEIWTVTFQDGDDGLVVEVIGESDDSPATASTSRWTVLREFLDGGGSGPGGRVRVRMPLDEAQALYRSLPPELILVVMPPHPSPWDEGDSTVPAP